VHGARPRCGRRVRRDGRATTPAPDAAGARDETDVRPRPSRMRWRARRRGRATASRRPASRLRRDPRALLAHVRDLLVDPVARIPGGDDLLEALGPALALLRV